MIYIIVASILAYMAVLFGISRVINNNTIADAGWGIGFMLIAILCTLFATLSSARALIVSVLVFLWGVRISFYLFKRTWGKPEDRRYQELRAKWGNREKLYSFLIVFMLQGALMLIIGYPIILVHIMPPVGLTWFDAVSIAIWFFGMFWEAVGDYQFAQFIHNPVNKGRIMVSGLWRYTRHPNYFGESVMWWALFLLVLPVSYGWTAIISPLLITGLLLFVSGIPMAEKPFDSNLEYQEYKKRTSAFIPWFEKKR
jgi:steroid 5-alpha reductase family enzyme